MTEVMPRRWAVELPVDTGFPIAMTGASAPGGGELADLMYTSPECIEEGDVIIFLDGLGARRPGSLATIRVETIEKEGPLGVYVVNAGMPFATKLRSDERFLVVRV